MKEIILVNRVWMQRDALYNVIKLEKIDQQLIPVSRIITVEPLTKSIRKDVIDEELRKQLKRMSLDDELGGSTIIYLEALGNPQYINVLEIPEAIYNQIYSE